MKFWPCKQITFLKISWVSFSLLSAHQRPTKQAGARLCKFNSYLKLISVHHQQSFQARPPRKPTLFVHIDGSPVTRSQFQAVLDKSLSFLQIKGHYKSHSFRIGMATELANQGFSNEKIQELGRWRSNSFLTYIRPHNSH